MSRILVVDDESNIRLMLRLALRASGHEVETAADGPEALEKFGQGVEFDLVLLDLIMPEMDGFELLSLMKDDPRLKDIPVIIMSANESSEVVGNCLSKSTISFTNTTY